jgi:hypothetical protein
VKPILVFVVTVALLIRLCLMLAPVRRVGAA